MKTYPTTLNLAEHTANMSALDLIILCKKLTDAIEQHSLQTDIQEQKFAGIKIGCVTLHIKQPANNSNFYDNVELEATFTEDGRTFQELIAVWRTHLDQQDNTGSQALERIGTTTTTMDRLTQIKHEISAVTDTCLLIHAHLHLHQQLSNPTTRNTLLTDLRNLGAKAIGYYTFIQNTITRPILETTKRNSQSAPNCRLFAIVACSEAPRMNLDDYRTLFTQAQQASKDTIPAICKIRFAAIPHSLNIFDSMSRLVSAEKVGKDKALACNNHPESWLQCDCFTSPINKREFAECSTSSESKRLVRFSTENPQRSQ